MASGKVVTVCWLEVALVMAPVRGDLLGSFLVADLFFRRLIISNNLFYYQHMALGTCIIFIIARALFLQLLFRVIDPLSFGLLCICMSVILTMFK